MVHIHEKLSKWLNSLMVSIKTGKIGRSEFLYKHKMPDVRDMRYKCTRKEETIRHIFTECPRLKEMKKIMWDLQG